MATKYNTRYPLNNLTIPQFTILLAEACDALQWRMGAENGDIVLAVPRSAFSYGEKVTIHIEGSEALVSSKHVQWQLGGNKKNGENLTALTARLNYLVTQYTPAQLDEKYDAAVAENEAYHQGLEERIKTGTLTVDEKIGLGFGGHYVTWGLIVLNILVFLVMAVTGAGLFEFDIDALYKWGGNVRSLTTAGEWYRLLTSMFLHAGLIHLLFNMYALFYVGLYLEPLLGKWRYLAVYLCTGIFASLTSIALHDDVISVGASGAIFGLYGLFLALLTTNLIDKSMRKPMLTSIGIFVGYNLLFGLKSGVDNAAHVGGLVSGAILGYLYYVVFSKRKGGSIAFVTIVLVITIAGAVLALPAIKTLPASDQVKYQRSMERFDEINGIALEPILQADSVFLPALTDKLKNVSLAEWQQATLLLDSVGHYKLKEKSIKKVGLLRKYVTLRIEQTNLFIKRNIEETNLYNPELISIDSSIGVVIHAIKTAD